MLTTRQECRKTINALIEASKKEEIISTEDAAGLKNDAESVLEAHPRNQKQQKAAQEKRPKSEKQKKDQTSTMGFEPSTLEEKEEAAPISSEDALRNFLSLLLPSQPQRFQESRF